MKTLWVQLIWLGSPMHTWSSTHTKWMQRGLIRWWFSYWASTVGQALGKGLRAPCWAKIDTFWNSRGVTGNPKIKNIIDFIWFPNVAIRKYHKLSDLEQQKCILSQFWRTEVWNQDVDRAKLPLKILGDNTFPNFWRSLACKIFHPNSVSIFTSSSLCISVPSFLLRTADTVFRAHPKWWFHLKILN